MNMYSKKYVRKVISFVIILAMSLPGISLNSKEAQAGMTAFTRQTINFNREWKFVRSDVENAEKEDYNDSSWYNVGLPHDFSIPYWQDERHFTGYGWYRKEFEVKQEWMGKRLSLDFAGVFHTAEVYINGNYVGVHEGGYTGFDFDITDYVRSGKNTVAIRVNNVWKADLAPRTGEHNFTGGIYRDVNLVITSPVHVTWYGTFVQTPDISKERSNVNMQTEIKNDSNEKQTVKVINQIFDADKNLVKTIESTEQSLEAGQTYNFNDTSDYIQNPNLWSPDHPYLYTVHTDVQVDGQSVDQYDTAFGFRWTEFTADEGFFLNGEHFWIDGADAHQDHAGWANAVTTAALRRDVAMIKEAGLNFIRGSHYPHSPAYAEACDELGVLFWSEASFWGTYAFGEGGENGDSRDYMADGYPTTGDAETEKAFEESCMANVRDMIRVNRNHPSIIVWSMGNEVFFGTNHDKKKALISRMAGYAKELDPSRATAMGGTQEGGYDKLENVDVAGYNGSGATVRNPGVPNLVSEYSTRTQNRPDKFTAYYGSVQTGDDGEPIQYEWRSGVALWCAFHHGSIMSRSYGDMGFIDYYRLPLQSWYYYRWKNTGVDGEHSISGTPKKLSLTASDMEITNDGTSDTHIIVTVQNSEGEWVDAAPEVTFEIEDGPGIFPTGKTMTFKPGDGMRDGKAAIEFRSYYVGETRIKAYSKSNPDLEPAYITIKTTGTGAADEPDVSTMYGAFMSNGGYVPNSIEEPTAYKYHNYNMCPSWASSGESIVNNMRDGDAATEWKAEQPGSGQWIYMELEHGGLNLYKAQLLFNGKVYPYKIQYKKMNIDESEWVTLKEYNSDTINTRPAEESFDGTYMRYIRIEFTDVPADEYASLAELKLYGIRSDLEGYKTGMKSLSEVQWKSEEASGAKASVDGSGNIHVQTDSELTYDLENDAAGYTRFQCRAELGADTGDKPVTIQVYCDAELIYEKDMEDPSSAENIDISVNKVKQLKLAAKSDSKNVDVTWADARVIGALRNISISNNDISTELFADMETLQSGKTLMLQPRFENKGENKKNLAAGVMLYRADGTPVLSKVVPVSVPARGRLAQDIMVTLPDSLNTLDHVKFVAWEEDSLMPVTELITITKEAGGDADVPGDTNSGSDRNEAGLLGAIGDAMNVIYAGDADRYTPDSKARFTEAVIAGDSVFNDKARPQADVNTAESAIRNAIAGLTLISSGAVSEGNGNGNGNADNGNGNNANNNNGNGNNENKPQQTAVPKKGGIYKYKKLKYKVTKFDGKTGSVSAYRPITKKLKTVTIPAAVKINGYKLTVTAVSDQAFYKNEKLKKVTIGSNVTSIGKKAFYGNAKLKTIVIKSKKLKKTGSLCFDKNNKKLKIKVPKSKKTYYVKKLKIKYAK